MNRVPLKEDAKAKAEREKKAAEAEAAAAKALSSFLIHGDILLVKSSM